jgi:digeranylgeranylglycerophospholipid reductase
MPSEEFDVVVAGGSVSGLFAARELASRGVSVIVLEEDHEIGTPEHCGGVVSLQGLNALGILPDGNVVQNNIINAQIKTRSSQISVNAANQNVLVIDRRLFDKQVARQAQREGAVIRTRCSFRSIEEDSSDAFIVKASDGDIHCHYVVDGRGIGSLSSMNKGNIIPSAQFEIYAEWIIGDEVEVFFDSDLYPGFFAWVIPIGDGMGKVGVAGRAINVSKSITNFIKSRGDNFSIIRKIFAPIWVGGPIESFVQGRVLKVGDCAGQTKPSTAGGIYSCGVAGIIAGRTIYDSIRRNDPSYLHNYERDWRLMFESEFKKLLFARKILERLDNRALDEIFRSFRSNKLQETIRTTDFDFHSNALSLILRSNVAIGLTKGLVGNEFRKIFGR